MENTHIAQRPKQFERGDASAGGSRVRRVRQQRRMTRPSRQKLGLGWGRAEG